MFTWPKTTAAHLLTLDQAAEHFRCSRRTIERLIKDGTLSECPGTSAVTKRPIRCIILPIDRENDFDGQYKPEMERERRAVLANLGDYAEALSQLISPKRYSFEVRFDPQTHKAVELFPIGDSGEVRLKVGPRFFTLHDSYQREILALPIAMLIFRGVLDQMHLDVPDSQNEQEMKKALEDSVERLMGAFTAYLPTPEGWLKMRVAEREKH